jgi:hypothetical protein
MQWKEFLAKKLEKPEKELDDEVSMQIIFAQIATNLPCEYCQVSALNKSQ